MGILLGYLFGGVLTPMVLKGIEVNSDIKVSNHANPIIFIGAIVFSAITVWISTYKPGKAAANVSPMEALRFNDVKYIVWHGLICGEIVNGQFFPLFLWCWGLCYLIQYLHFHRVWM